MTTPGAKQNQLTTARCQGAVVVADQALPPECAGPPALALFYPRERNGWAFTRIHIVWSMDRRTTRSGADRVKGRIGEKEVATKAAPGLEPNTIQPESAKIQFQGFHFCAPTPSYPKPTLPNKTCPAACSRSTQQAQMLFLKPNNHQTKQPSKQATNQSTKSSQESVSSYKARKLSRSSCSPTPFLPPSLPPSLLPSLPHSLIYSTQGRGGNSYIVRILISVQQLLEQYKKIICE